MSIDIVDWLKATRDTRVVGQDALLNEATKHKYFYSSKMFKNEEKKFKGGERLVDYLQGRTLGNAGFYNPVNRFNVTSRDTSTRISVPWAFLQGHYPIIEELQSLNEGDTDRFFDYIDSQEQACVTDKVNILEESLFALPNRTTMEDEATPVEGRVPYSILSFITRDGLAPSSSNGGVAAGTPDWTTIQGANPADADMDWYRNQTDSYDAANPGDPTQGIIPAFDRMILKVQFDVPDDLRKYATDDDLQKQCILTNRDGYTKYQDALRKVNESMMTLPDPSIAGPQYQGIPVKYVSELDNVGWTANQPDFLWTNLGFLFPYCQTGAYFREKITQGSHDHPNKVVVWKFTHFNRICRSRRRQGRVSAA